MRDTPAWRATADINRLEANLPAHQACLRNVQDPLTHIAARLATIHAAPPFIEHFD